MSGFGFQLAQNLHLAEITTCFRLQTDKSQLLQDRRKASGEVGHIIMYAFGGNVQVLYLAIHEHVTLGSPIVHQSLGIEAEMSGIGNGEGRTFQILALAIECQRQINRLVQALQHRDKRCQILRIEVPLQLALIGYIVHHLRQGGQAIVTDFEAIHT